MVQFRHTLPVFTGVQVYVNDGFRWIREAVETVGLDVGSIAGACIIADMNHAIRDMISMANRELTEYYAVGCPAMRG